LLESVQVVSSLHCLFYSSLTSCCYFIFMIRNPDYRVTTLQTMWNSLTVLHGTRHVKCNSYHARSSVTVSGGGRNATVHDPKPYT